RRVSRPWPGRRRPFPRGLRQRRDRGVHAPPGVRRRGGLTVGRAYLRPRIAFLHQHFPSTPPRYRPLSEWAGFTADMPGTLAAYGTPWHEPAHIGGRLPPVGRRSRASLLLAEHDGSPNARSGSRRRWFLWLADHAVPVGPRPIHNH